MDTRYQGKPFLRLLECYVLSVIEELASSDRENLEKMTPKLREIYGLEGDWKMILSQVMQLPDSFEDNVRSLWSRNSELAMEQGQELPPEVFAQMMVDLIFTGNATS